MDAISHNPEAAVETLISLCPTCPSSKDVHFSDKIDAAVQAATIQATTMLSWHLTTFWHRAEVNLCTKLINAINQGFPHKGPLTKPDIHDFWELQNWLSTDRGLVLMHGRIVIPKSLRTKILHCLHAAHQGVDGMKTRANNTIYWPGMNASICNFRVNCPTCTTIVPNQPWEPIIMTPAPEWPFQQIVMNIFHICHIAYLACADRLTSWLILHHLKPGHATTSKLMFICWHLFQTYGTPDELSTDGGPPFTFSIFQEFLQTWCVRHRLSSVTYPQSNGWAEFAVKTAKRIVNGNTGPPRFLGKRQCCSGHSTTPKHPNPRYWPITSTTPTLPLTPWFHFLPFTANSLQATANHNIQTCFAYFAMFSLKTKTWVK